MESMDEQLPACHVPAASSKLRYPLRSGGRLKPMSGTTDASATPLPKRERPPSSVSKSVSVLSLSSKEKPVKSPRRLSNPAKSTVRSCPTTLGSTTPISEIRIKKANAQGKADTPHSEASSTCRRKFNVLTSVSYWLTQIKLAESASKHSISLGFFKLALEAGCEPLQRMREELKSYTCRHNLLAELGEPTEDLLQCYNILEDLLQLRITSLHAPEAEDPTLNEDSCKQPAIGRSGNLKPRSLNSETTAVPESIKKERSQKRTPTVHLSTKNSVQPCGAKDANGKNARNKYQKPGKMAGDSGKSNVKCLAETTNEKVDSVDHLPLNKSSYEDKENMGTLPVVEARVEEEIESC